MTAHLNLKRGRKFTQFNNVTAKSQLGPVTENARTWQITVSQAYFALHETLHEVQNF